jgi:hypothetical protein
MVIASKDYCGFFLPSYRHMLWLVSLCSKYFIELLWLMALLFDLESGSMEFVVPAADPSAFFPININFSSNKTFCDLKVGTVLQVQGGNPVRFAKRTQLVVDSYQVV